MPDPETAPQSSTSPRLSKNEQQRRAAAAADLELRITALEAEIERLTGELQAAGEDGAYQEVQRISAAIAEAQAEVDAAYAAWDAVMAELG